jgi:hypothetical protein
LTHVGSKGHLGAHQKLLIKAMTDTDAKASIDKFNMWYAEHEIQSLLAARMAEREKKDKKKRKAQDDLNQQVRKVMIPNLPPISIAN